MTETLDIVGVTMSDGPVLALTPEQAATALQVSRATIYRMLERRELPSFLLGRSRRVSVKALQDFIDAAQAS